jgi:hypothetical protein
MKAESYAGTTPELRIEEYFLGEVRAWGIFQDRSGKVKRQFTVDIRGEMQHNELVLTEDFLYDDGERSQRVWRIRRLDQHNYEGRADDVIGTAQGRAFGKALNWQYNLDLPVGNKRYKVHFDDWMILHADGVLINRAVLSKFGINLGEVTLFFRRLNES